MADDCVFCNIVKGKIPAEKVYEDNKMMAFMDIMPANKGHALVVTKNHYETIMDVPDRELAELIILVKKIAKAADQGMAPGGFNIVQYNRPVAGQVIPHIHFHVIPRFKGDGIVLNWKQGSYKEGEIGEYAKNIKSFIS